MSYGDGIQIDRSELEKLMNKQGIGVEAVKKEPLTVGTIIMRGISLIIAFAYFILLIYGEELVGKDSEFLLSLDIFSDIEKPNKVIRIIGLIIFTLSISRILQFFISLLARNKGITKRTGVALIELIQNLVKYVSIIILLFLILSALGVNTAELLAGLGILSLIFGLGVTSLIEDIVAGFFIIAEHLFDVGDIVVIDDFRGTVLSIGIRSTQLEDEGGDILILRNSSIESLVNMTNHLSYAICDIPISADVPFEKVEEVIKNAELENLMEQYDDIEGGPFYLGLSEIQESGIQLITFVAICQESKRYSVQRIMNRELKILFDNNDIQLGGDEE
ncbi:MAG: mechanosensitive ion channel family protein [Lachnospiraceae bacterium]|nr:mechanosensitive ion channel family protein [Lachnospiraceae bacterium]